MDRIKKNVLPLLVSACLILSGCSASVEKNNDGTGSRSRTWGEKKQVSVEIGDTVVTAFGYSYEYDPYGTNGTIDVKIESVSGGTVHAEEIIVNEDMSLTTETDFVTDVSAGGLSVNEITFSIDSSVEKITELDIYITVTDADGNLNGDILELEL